MRIRLRRSRTRENAYSGVSAWGTLAFLWLRGTCWGGLMRFSALAIFAVVNFVAVLTIVWWTTGLVDCYRAGVVALGIPMILKILSP